MVRALQARIPKSSIVECNVLYPSPRQTTEGHRETLRTNGWTFCPVDIMDADGEVSLPIPGGRHLRGCPACFLILKGVVISSHETNRFS